MKMIGLSCIFPCNDIRKTAEYYESRLGFKTVVYLQCEQPHICIYKDNIEIILTQSNCRVVPNRELYGYGYDASFMSKISLKCRKN